MNIYSLIIVLSSIFVNKTNQKVCPYNAYIRDHFELHNTQDFGLVEWLAGVDFQYRWVVEGQGYGHGQGHIRRGLRTIIA